LGDVLAARLKDVELVQDVETPFGKPSGPILLGQLGKHRFAFLARHGPGHHYGPGAVPYAANIFALKKLGCRSVIATGAVGSLNEEIAPGHVVLVDQFIDKTSTSKRQSTFYDKLGAVYCEFAHPCCPRLRECLQQVAQEECPNNGTTVHSTATYVCMEGPQFSTRAESLMHRQWGGDLIGMTALPEAKLAREAQMCYALVALVSDYDCWKEHHAAPGKSLLEEVMGNLQRATDNAIALVEKLLESERELCSDDCSCRKSLELAVWSKPEAVDQAEKEKLAPLFE